MIRAARTVLAGLRRVSADNAVERAVLVAVAVETPDEVAAVLMTKRNRKRL